MFKLPETQDERIDAIIAGYVAHTEGESFIMASKGRRKPGRKTKYFVYVNEDFSFSITAGSNAEAVEKANQRIKSQEANDERVGRT